VNDSINKDRVRICLLTPRGAGAIGSLKAWGPGAIELADRVFRPAFGARLIETPPGRSRLGRIGAGTGDEVVVSIDNLRYHIEFESLDVASFESVEVHCHGGAAAIELVTSAFVEAGAERVDASRWTIETSPSELIAEARRALEDASTTRVAKILLDQAAGAFDREIVEILDTIDRDPDSALERIRRLIARGSWGTKLVEGFRVVIAGKPNVGKSRLLNALAGYGRAIVDPAPGTTRDLVTERTAIDGLPVELVDTAGIRETTREIESMGIDLAIKAYKSADLIILLFDRSRPLDRDDFKLIEELAPFAPIQTANKSDLACAWSEAEDERIGVDRSRLVVSAERGDGLDLLLATIADRLVADPPPPGSAVPFRESTLRTLQEAETRLNQNDLKAAVPILGSLLSKNK
jgi:tRNA modification GTPase